MNRYLFGFALTLCAGSVRAEDRSPEQILPSTTQAYARWDGIAAHQKAYDASARGQMYAGETGKVFDAVWSRICRQLKVEQVGNPLLNGQAPDELGKALSNIKKVAGLPKLLAQTGLVVGFEIRPPGSDLGNIFDLIAGDQDKRRQAKVPQVLLTVIIPGGAQKAELAGGLALIVREEHRSAKERTIDGRKIATIGEDADSFKMSFWDEGKHFVITISNLPVERMYQKIKMAGAGITEHSLFKKLGEFKEFEVVTRGFVDVGKIVTSFEKVIKTYEPRMWPFIESLGADTVRSVCFWDGFEGTDSRGVIEIDMPGQRKGATKAFKPIALTAGDLPPLPADLTRFTAARMDLGEIVETLIGAVGFSERSNQDREFPPDEQFRKNKEFIAQAVDAGIGVKMADLLQSLGDKVVTYQAPSDGILNLGQVLIVSVTDEKALRRHLESITRKLETVARNGLAVKKHVCQGVEVRQFVVKDRSPVTISYAICDGWFVIGLQPQPVRGFIYRAKGKLPTWKPDARTAATLAKVPADRNVIQVADPRATLNWLCSAAPIISAMTASRDGQEPLLDPGIFPVASEMNQHLYPNVMWCRDDGKVMRWESRDSLWLPAEAIGLEFISIYAAVAGAFFF